MIDWEDLTFFVWYYARFGINSSVGIRTVVRETEVDSAFLVEIDNVRSSEKLRIELLVYEDHSCEEEII